MCQLRLSVKQLLQLQKTHIRPPLCPLKMRTRAASHWLTAQAGRNENQPTRVIHSVNTGIVLASLFTSLAAAAGALGIDSGHKQWPQRQQVLEFKQGSTQVSEQDSSSNSSKWACSSTPFDVALASVISLADTLSQATGEFVDLTEAAQAAELVGNDDTYMASTGSLNASDTARPMYKLINRHGAAANGITASGQGYSATLALALSPSQQAYMGVASRMSHQAMAVAGEALKLTTLLDSQDKDIDPSYHSLLQQIIEAARNVSAVAADIAEPGDWLVDDGLGSSSSSTARGQQ